MILCIDPDHPEPRKVRRAVDALEAGEVIAYPTDTAYGLGCDLLNKKGIERLFEMKRLPRTHPLTFICPDLADIARYAIVENQAYRILRHYLPGPYCFILDATREVPKLLQSKKKTVGIRVPKHEITLALVRALGRPIVSTTASLGGDEPMIDPREIADTFQPLGLVVDGGAGGLLSTSIIDLTKRPPEVLREGAGDVSAFL